MLPPPVSREALAPECEQSMISGRVSEQSGGRGFLN